MRVLRKTQEPPRELVGRFFVAGAHADQVVGVVDSRWSAYIGTEFLLEDIATGRLRWRRPTQCLLLRETRDPDGALRKLPRLFGEGE